MRSLFKNKPEWSARMYREGDEEQIQELRTLTLSGEKDNDWWQWFYRDGPAGPALIWLAESGEKIVGHAAHVPVRIKLGDRELTGDYAEKLIYD